MTTKIRKRIPAAAKRVAVRRNASESPFELDELLPYLVNRVANTTVQLFSRDLSQFNLSVPMWRVIAVLTEMGEQRLVDLASMTSIDASTLSRLTETMNDAGLIAKIRSDENKRELLLNVTSRGRELTRILAPVAHAYEKRMTSGLSPEALKTTRRSLIQMFENLLELKSEAAKQDSTSRRHRPILAKNMQKVI